MLWVSWSPKRGGEGSYPPPHCTDSHFCAGQEYCQIQSPRHGLGQAFHATLQEQCSVCRSTSRYCYPEASDLLVGPNSLFWYPGQIQKRSTFYRILPQSGFHFWSDCATYYISTLSNCVLVSELRGVFFL